MAQTIRSHLLKEKGIISLEGIFYPTDFTNFNVCVNYMKEKQTNIRRLCVSRTPDVLELIHMDICRPFSSAFWNGQCLHITFIDNYYRYCYLYLILKKSQSLNIFKAYKIEVENQFDKKIKQVRSNRGDEYYRDMMDQENNAHNFLLNS